MRASDFLKMLFTHSFLLLFYSGKFLLLSADKWHFCPKFYSGMLLFKVTEIKEYLIDLSDWYEIKS